MNGIYKHKSGKELFHLNNYETDFIWKEIYEDKVYMKNGITLTCNSVIVDIGANIGLFAVFLNEYYQGCRIYLVEPSPILCEIIKANTQQFKEQVTVITAGISNKEKEAVFTFYPGYSIISGFKTDLDKDYEFIRGGIRNQLSKLKLDKESEDRYVESLLQGKLDKPQSFNTKLITLSNLIEKEKIANIDLLKIDAEGCEFEALEGLGQKDWKKIRQIVMEVHDHNGAMIRPIREHLVSHNYRVIVEQEENLKTTGIYNLYAFCSNIDANSHQ